MSDNTINGVNTNQVGSTQPTEDSFSIDHVGSLMYDDLEKKDATLRTLLNQMDLNNQYINTGSALLNSTDSNGKDIDTQISQLTTDFAAGIPLGQLDQNSLIYKLVDLYNKTRESSDLNLISNKNGPLSNFNGFTISISTLINIKNSLAIYSSNGVSSDLQSLINEGQSLLSASDENADANLKDFYDMNNLGVSSSSEDIRLAVQTYINQLMDNQSILQAQSIASDTTLSTDIDQVCSVAYSALPTEYKNLVDFYNNNIANSNNINLIDGTTKGKINNLSGLTLSDDQLTTIKNAVQTTYDSVKNVDFNILNKTGSLQFYSNSGYNFYGPSQYLGHTPTLSDAVNLYASEPAYRKDGLKSVALTGSAVLVDLVKKYNDYVYVSGTINLITGKVGKLDSSQITGSTKLPGDESWEGGQIIKDIYNAVVTANNIKNTANSILALATILTSETGNHFTGVYYNNLQDGQVKNLINFYNEHVATNNSPNLLDPSGSTTGKITDLPGKNYLFPADTLKNILQKVKDYSLSIYRCARRSSKIYRIKYRSYFK